jgi:DNA-directed RNA polymerase specialized sigma24 family protein
MQQDGLPPGKGPAARRHDAAPYSSDAMRAQLARIRLGDLQARDQVLGYFNPWLVRIADGFRHVESTVDDVYGQGYLILVQVLETLVIPPGADPRAAILGALQIAIKRYARKQYNVARWEFSLTSLSPEALAEALAAVIDGTTRDHPSLSELLNRPDPNSHVEGEVVWRVTLQQALASLPDFPRRVLQLHVEQGRTFDQIGMETHTQAATCRKSFERSRDRLSRDLRESFPEVGADRPDGKRHR